MVSVDTECYKCNVNAWTHTVSSFVKKSVQNYAEWAIHVNSNHHTGSNVDNLVAHHSFLRE